MHCQAQAPDRGMIHPLNAWNPRRKPDPGELLNLQS